MRHAIRKLFDFSPRLNAVINATETAATNANIAAYPGTLIYLPVVQKQLLQFHPMNISGGGIFLIFAANQDT